MSAKGKRNKGISEGIKAAANGNVSKELGEIAPSFGAFLQDIAKDAGIAETALSFVPQVETAIATLQVVIETAKALGVKPADQDSLVWQREEDNIKTGG